MNPLQLILLGLIAGAAAGMVVLLGAAPFVPFARAARAGLAGVIGGAIGFLLTALLQAPFYAHTQDLATLATPFGVAALVAAAGAALAAAVILRAGRSKPNH